MSTRRITRARSGSQEPAGPAQVKPKTRPKQSALAVVPESPAKRSSGAFSGTTANHSVLVQAAVSDESEELVDSLDDLWKAAKQFLDVVLPDSVTHDSIQLLITRLQNAPRYRNAILKQYEELKNAMTKYPESPINTTATCLTIFGLSNDSELRDGPHRPDEVLYRANLAYVVGIFITKLAEDFDDFDPAETLQFFIKSLFSKVVKSDQKNTIGSTSILKQTFDLALEFQTQAYILDLQDQLGEEDSIPDPTVTMMNMFYTDDGSTFRGWDVSGLRFKQFSKSQRAAIADRVSSIKRFLQNDDVEDCLKEMKAEFPLGELVYKFFWWAQQRNEELVQHVDSIPQAVVGIQEAIDTEIRLFHAQNGQRDAVPATASSVNNQFAIPARPAKTKPSTKKELYNTMRASINLSRPQSSAATSTFAGPSAQVEYPNIERDATEDREFEPMVFTGNDIADNEFGEQTNDNDDVAGVILSPEEVMKLSQAVHRNDIRANKENRVDSPSQHSQRPAKQFFRTEPSPELGTSRSNGSTRVDKGKRRRDEESDQEEEQDRDQTSDFEPTQDTGFETQIPPEQGPNKRRHPVPRSQRAAASTMAGSTAIASRPRYVNYEENNRQILTQELSQRAQLHSKVNKAAKDIVSKANATKPPQRRTPWSEVETGRLLELIDLHGISWTKLKAFDEELGSVLRNRDQVALKDKARNIKMDYLKAGRRLPHGFEAVALKTADRQRLRDLGCDVGNLDPHSGAEDVGQE